MQPIESPVGPHLGAFEQSLLERGYRARTVQQYTVKCRTFDAFLVDRGIDLASLTENAVEEFLDYKLPQRRHRSERRARRWWSRPLRLLLDHLRRVGAVPEVSLPGPSDPPLLIEYACFLRDHRGVTEKNVEGQQRHLRRFLSYVGFTGEADLGPWISAEHIDGFLVEMSRHLERASVNSACSALRGFLRYLRLRGVLQVDLAQQVTRPRFYSLANLPRAIDWRDVERTLELVDRSTLVGARDYAVLALLAYCGLRAGEVAGLRLEDLDWSHDTIRIARLKSQTIDVLPLVPSVGEALIAYLHHRPPSACPHVFLKVLAPAGPLSRPVVSWIARKYLLQAGIRLPRLGAHTFRHSYAVRLLRQGFPLKTIGDALGHRHPQSTYIYTKAAVDDLRAVALDLTEVLP